MANTYGVVPADIAAELPGVVPGGFDTTTKPTLALVQTWIDVADLNTTIHIQDVAAALPLSSDRIAPLAKRVIIERVKAMVLRLIYTGNAPQDVLNATKPYDDMADGLLDAITTLGSQAAGTGDPIVKIRTSADANPLGTRDLIVCDVDLNPGPAGHGSGYFGGRRQGQF